MSPITNLCDMYNARKKERFTEKYKEHLVKAKLARITTKLAKEKRNW